MKEIKISVMQPYFFSYLGYWQLINESDKFIFFDDVSYINKGYIDRNYIIYGGQRSKIKLELFKASQNKLINEINIGNNKLKILRQIDLAYRNSPRYEYFMPIVNDIMMNNENNLARFLGYSIEKIAEYLEIKTKFLYSSNFNTGKTGRNKIKDLTLLNNGNIYLNMIGGKFLYDQDDFYNSGIKLIFLKHRVVRYPQKTEEFNPYVSILDLCFNLSTPEIKELNILKGHLQ